MRIIVVGSGYVRLVTGACFAERHTQKDCFASLAMTLMLLMNDKR